MKVLVDTNIWSLALRRKAAGENVDRLKELILSHQVVMIGPIRQELLSGIANEKDFSRLKSTLDAYDDFHISTHDYITAAKFYNICRRQGIQGSTTDFLICAVAANNDMFIYTNDKDFDNFLAHLPIRLF